MTSTDKPFVMPATQLAYSIKTLSESVILHLKAHKHFSEQDLDQLAEQLIAKLLEFINKHHCPRNAASNETKSARHDYKTIYGQRLNTLSEMARTLADSVEENEGRTHHLYERPERETLFYLINLLADAGILRIGPLSCNGYTQDKLLSILASGALTFTSPEVTITSDSVTVAAINSALAPTVK